MSSGPEADTGIGIRWMRFNKQGEATLTTEQWRRRFPATAELTDRPPHGINPGRVWTRLWMGDHEQVVSGNRFGDPRFIGFTITASSVPYGRSILVRDELHWRREDRGFITCAIEEWQRVRGGASSEGIAVDDFKLWFREAHPAHMELVDRDTENLLSRHFPALDIWSLYADYPHRIEGGGARQP